MDTPGTFPGVDRKLLTNPAYMRKVRHRFSNVPFLFNMYFINQPGIEYTREALDAMPDRHTQFRFSPNSSWRFKE